MSSTGRTYWLAKDSAWHRRDGIVELGEEFGPAGPLIIDWLGCEAKAQNAGGFVKTGFRAVARSCYVDPDTARKVVRHAAEIGVLDELEETGGGRILVCRLSGWRSDQSLARDATRKANTRDMQGGQNGTDPDQPGQAVRDEDVSGQTMDTTGKERREQRKKTPSSSSEIGDKEGDRPDVDGLCSLLAGLVAENAGAKPKPVPREWRRECRLLLDRDGRTVEQVRWIINWCQADAFWKGNVRSMPKLREQFDQLVIKAKAERIRPNGASASLDDSFLAQLNAKNAA